MTFRSAAIVAVGSEMLTPHRLDTNSLAITELLDRHGIPLLAKAVVGDNRAELVAQLRFAWSRAELVIVTGGLGPTLDDLTREAVAELLGRALVEDRSIVQRIEARFAARGARMPEVNRRQAQVIGGATVLQNPNGTAPGQWITDGSRGMALLPGPPREMRPMLQEAADRFFPLSSETARLHTRLIRTAGRTESRIEELTAQTYSRWGEWPLPIETTILAVSGQIELHLAARSADAKEADTALDRAVAELLEVLGPDVVSTDGRSMEQALGDLLKARKWRIALAESCTGGLATSRLTDVPGSSAYTDRSVVVYSNEAKTQLLGIPETLLREHGAVSEPVAVAMANGVRTLGGSEVGVGITGIAGPDGGTPAKPVGTVAIAVAAGEAVRVRTFRFPGGRDQVKAFSVLMAFDMVRRALLDASGDVDWGKA